MYDSGYVLHIYIYITVLDMYDSGYVHYIHIMQVFIY